LHLFSLVGIFRLLTDQLLLITIIFSEMAKPSRVLPVWVEYAQIKEQLALRKSPQSPQPKPRPEPRFSLDLDLASDFPSVKQSLFNSPSLSMSNSYCADRRSVPNRSSALQDTVEKLKGEVERLKSACGPFQKAKKLYIETAKVQSYRVGARAWQSLQDKATQVVAAGRTGSQLVSCNISQSDIEKWGELTNRTEEDEMMEWIGGKEGSKAPASSFYISFDDEKPYEYLAEAGGIAGWVTVKLQGDQFRTKESQAITLSGPQLSDMYLSSDGISGGYRVFTKVPKHRRRSERLLKVKAFGHCVQMSESEVLCSGLEVTSDH